MTGPLPGPGWHPDPGNPQFWRRWDGSAWSAHVAPMVAHSLSPRALLVAEEGLAPWARSAVVIYPILAFATGLFGWIYASRYQHYFHYVRLTIDGVRNGHTVYQSPPSLVGWNTLFFPLVTAAQIVFLVWQYRAANVGRQLGYPFRRSPGWGVALWFIPIVNLWMPYQAIRDCLPPGHAERGTVLQTWILLLVTNVSIQWLTIASAYDRPLGVVVLACLAGLEFALALCGYRVMKAIGEEHRRAVENLGELQRP